MTKITNFLKYIEEYISAILFAFMVILIFLQVLFRFIFNFPLSWTEESARYIMIILVYLSAVSAVKQERHLRVQAIQMLLPDSIAFILWILSNLIWFGFNAVMVVYGYQMANYIFTTGQVSPALHVPMGMLYMVIPVCFFLMEIRLVQIVIRKIRPLRGLALQKPHNRNS